MSGCSRACSRGHTRAEDASADAAKIASVDAGAVDAAVDSGPSIAKDLDVIVISIDSLRADMPWAGYARAIAPRLTELEKRSVSYTNAYSISSYTSMSLGGFLGGKIPSEMSRSGYFFGRYGDSNVMFPELLQAHGIQTIAAHAHGYFKDSGMQQGFDVWEVLPVTFKNETDPNVTAPEHEALAEKLLSAVDPTKRFFAWFHFLDPHDQYMSHEKDGIAAYGPTLRDRYDAEVTFTDRWVGKLLDFVEAQPWAKKTVIIVTADHGESFGEHGRYAHGFELWQGLVRVPLFFIVPGVAPRKIDVNRSAVDLAPTLCDLFGVAPDPSFEGKSLVPELLGAEPEERDVVLDLPMTSDNDKRRAIVHDHEKIIAFGKDEMLMLYDLAKDPKEEHPIQRGEAFQEMARRYRAYAKSVKDKEVAPFLCGEGCLNGTYAKPAGTGEKTK